MKTHKYNNNNNNDNDNSDSHNKQMQQINTERVQDLTRLGGQGDPLGNVQEI